MTVPTRVELQHPFQPDTPLFDKTRISCWRGRVSAATEAFRKSISDSSLCSKETKLREANLGKVRDISETLQQDPRDHANFHEDLGIWENVIKAMDHSAMDHSASQNLPTPGNVLCFCLICLIKIAQNSNQQKVEDIYKMITEVSRSLESFRAPTLSEEKLLTSHSAQDEVVNLFNILVDIFCIAASQFRKRTVGQIIKQASLVVVYMCGWGEEKPTLEQAIGKLHQFNKEHTSRMYMLNNLRFAAPFLGEVSGRGSHTMSRRSSHTHVYLPLEGMDSTSFFGRQETIDRATSFFTQDSISNSRHSGLHRQAFVLWGMPGVGKTELAIKISMAVKAQNSDMHIFWVSSDGRPSLVQGMHKIAEVVGIVHGNEPENVRVESVNQGWVITKVREWLSASHKRWLLILDNALDNESLSEFLPSSGNGRILITTRNSEMMDKYAPNTEEIKSFSNEDGQHCFLNFLPHSYREEASQDPRLYDLITELGALPLAISQAASYIRDQRCSIQLYFDRLKGWKDSNAFLDPRGVDTIPAVTATFTLIYDTLGTETKAFLDILAWLNPDQISQCMLASHRMHGFEQAMQDLLRKGLIARWDEFISVHRVVQMTIIQGMSETNRARTLNCATKLIVSRFSSRTGNYGAINPLAYPDAGELRLLHLNISSLSEKHRQWLSKVFDNELASLCKWLGSYLLDISGMQEAETMLKKSYDLYAKSEDKQHERSCTLAGLSFLSGRAGNLPTALDMANKAITMMEEASGPVPHPHMAWLLSNRGRIYLFRGNIDLSLQDAKQSYELIQNVQQENPDDDSIKPYLYLYMNFYAISLYAKSRGGIIGDLYEPQLSSEDYEGTALEEESEALREPIRLCTESISGLQACPGWESTLAWTKLSLSWMLLYTHRFKKAEELTRESLVHIQLAFKPAETCGIGVTIIQLGDCYLLQGNHPQALESYKLGLHYLEKTVGEQNPSYLTACHKLANFHCRDGNYKEACEYFKVALDGFSRIYGDSNPSTKMTENNYAIALIKSEDKERGLELLQNSLKFRESHYGKKHKLTCRVSANCEAASRLFLDGGDPTRRDGLDNGVAC